jgi:hypothetical protein
LGLLLALVALGGGPVPARAANLVFRNEMKTPIIVQGASIVNNVIRPGRAMLIYPNQGAADMNLPAGNRLITIYDANQPSRILFRETVPVAGMDLYFSVQADPVMVPVGPRPPAMAALPPRAKLVSVKPPPPPARPPQNPQKPPAQPPH